MWDVSSARALEWANRAHWRVIFQCYRLTPVLSPHFFLSHRKRENNKKRKNKKEREGKEKKEREKQTETESMAPTTCWNLRVSAEANQGGRKYMEDVTAVHFERANGVEFASFAIKESKKLK